VSEALEKNAGDLVTQQGRSGGHTEAAAGPFEEAPSHERVDWRAPGAQMLVAVLEREFMFINAPRDSQPEHQRLARPLRRR
jgi:hypothetical protein